MLRVVLFFLLFQFAFSALAQQNTLVVIESKDTSIYEIIYQDLDSLSESKLIGFFKEMPAQKAIQKRYYLGKQSGKEYTYFPSGEVYELSIYQNGKRDGDYSRYNSLGELVIKARYGNGELSGFYINRKEHYQGKYSKGLKHGKWEYNVGFPNYYKEFFKQGKRIEKRQVIPDDLKIFNRKRIEIEAGPKSPHEDSILVPMNGDSTWFKLKYVSQDSLAHPAMRKAYFKDFPKQLAHTKYVYNGYVNGMYKVYFPNGQLYLFANYTAGLLDGNWKVYDDNGVLKTKGKYLDGKKVGVWKVNLGTNQERKEVYRSGVLKTSSSKAK